TSEYQPQGQLDVARACLLAGELAEVRVGDVGDQTAYAVAVERVQEGGAQFDIALLVELECLLKADVLGHGVTIAHVRQVRAYCAQSRNYVLSAGEDRGIREGGAVQVGR